MRSLQMSVWLALLVLWVDPVPARPDLIFQVPEVLVRHAAVPRPVGTGPALNGTLPRPVGAGLNGTWNHSASDEVHLERTDYFVEHDISTTDAKKAAHILKLSQVPESLAGCGKCSRWEMEYCESSVLADHCCCERRYLPEPFPWMPHTCYIGPERCVPLAQNCARYARIRDCCCQRKMAEKWKGILSKASSLSFSGMVLLLLSLILFTLYL